MLTPKIDTSEIMEMNELFLPLIRYLRAMKNSNFMLWAAAVETI
jgi:hypothetical protein